MSKYLRYTGEFLSRAGVVWRTDIMQEGTALDCGELTFPADEPLVIEWDSRDKEEVICGSTATLKVISPGDRTYQDLYTIAVGSIRLDVYRGGSLYWSGLLDPEFYEEPYECASGYEVSFTFSDFGILDRIKYDLTGMQSIRDIVLRALARSGIQYSSLDYTSLISSELYATDLVDSYDDLIRSPIEGLSVRSENFTDEDGEVSTLYEVLEGVLQPLAVRMVQRAGVVWLYDLNGLYSQGTAQAIQWDGDSQTMGTDKVANNVKVTFSPYGNGELMSSEVVEYGGKYDVEHDNLTSNAPSDPTQEYGEYYSYYPDYDQSRRQEGTWDYNLIDFTIFIHRKGSGLQDFYPASDLYSLGAECRYFHILPVTGGATECSGVAYAFRTGGHGSIDTGWPKWKVHTSVPCASLSGNASLFATNRVFLPRMREDAAKKYFVRVAEELLIDARYNPFSGSTSGNDEAYDYLLKGRSAFVFIPAKITLYDADGEALYHYSNKDTAAGAVRGSLAALGKSGTWAAGADPGGDCWLEYYNPEDLTEDAGIRGWKKNRHCIGRPDGKGGRIGLTWFDSFKKIDEGEYLPYPPSGGYLEVEIQAGVLGYDFGQDCDNCAFGSTDSQWHQSNIYNMLRWMLYKAPTVDVVSNNLAFETAGLDDIEYSGYINKSAKDEISIDTVCGTTANACPTAKGEYYRTDSGEALSGNMSRAGRKNCPEKLLIGTLYSQYAGRKTILSGDAAIDGGLHYYTERNQSGKRFMLKGEVQNVIADSTEAEYCEFRPDEYDCIEEVK